jgi:DNA-binding transcriptional MerR regulator
MSTTYSIGDLAREFDLTTRAIRFYEDLGLLQPQRTGPGGRSRVYSGRDRTRSSSRCAPSAWACR